MPYRVEEYSSLMPDADHNVYGPDELEQALNKAEADGWSLVKVIDQHRQWPDEDDEDDLGTGYLRGPFFIFYKADGLQ